MGRWKTLFRRLADTEKTALPSPVTASYGFSMRRLNLHTSMLIPKMKLLLNVPMTLLHALTSFVDHQAIFGWSITPRNVEHRASDAVSQDSIRLVYFLWIMPSFLWKFRNDDCWRRKARPSAALHEWSVIHEKSSMTAYDLNWLLNSHHDS